MLDYIYVDYLYYIFRYSIFIAIGVFCACLIYMAVYGTNKVVKGFLIFSVIAVLVGIINPSFEPYGGAPHYCCNNKFEGEAQNIASAIADYFSDPSKTQVPNYSDLDFSRGSYTHIGNGDLKRRDKLIKDSGFYVEIMGDDTDEITIVLSCKKGKCPFYRWKCPRRHKGEIYVLRMEGSGVNEWLDSWEDI